MDNLVNFFFVTGIIAWIAGLVWGVNRFFGRKPMPERPDQTDADCCKVSEPDGLDRGGFKLIRPGIPSFRLKPNPVWSGNCPKCHAEFLCSGATAAHLGHPDEPDSNFRVFRYCPTDGCPTIVHLSPVGDGPHW